MKKTLKLITLLFSTLMTVILLTVFGFTSVNAIKSSADENDIVFDMNNFKSLSDSDFRSITYDSQDIYLAFDYTDSMDYTYQAFDWFTFVQHGDETLYFESPFETTSNVSEFTTVYSVSHNDKQYKVINLTDFINSENFSNYLSANVEDGNYPTTFYMSYNIDDLTLVYDTAAKENAENNQDAVLDNEESTNIFENIGEWFNGTFATETAIVGLVVLVVIIVILKKIL